MPEENWKREAFGEHLILRWEIDRNIGSLKDMESYTYKIDLQNKSSTVMSSSPIQVDVIN